MENQDNPPGGLLSAALASSLAPKRATGLWFASKSITLDGYEFVECRFDRCKLHVNNAQNVHLERCFISDDTQIVFGQSALSAIKLFNLKNRWYYQNAPVYVPEKDSLGRITLTNKPFNYLANLFAPTNE